MKYCKSCVQPDTRPGIQFNEEGICPACQYMDKAQDIDWEERNKELQRIVEFGKSQNVSGYDCIIGVSGGKDSTRLSMYVRDELGMKPLLVSCMFPPEQQSECGAHNLGNLISLGFDTIAVGPAPETWKKLMRQGFLKYGNHCKSTEMALYACLPRAAIAYHIPLIFLGENPAIQLGDLGVGSMTWDGNKMKYSNTIASGPDDLILPGMTEQDIIWYRYPSDEEMVMAKIQIVYLGYFWKNFTKPDNAAFAMSHGLDIRDEIPENMGALYPFEALDEDFVFVNQMMKYIKLGFGKMTDDVSEQVRFDYMPREKALDLVKRYDGNCAGEYIKKYCHYLGITEEKFWQVAEKFRNQSIWEKDANGEWELKAPLE